CIHLLAVGYEIAAARQLESSAMPLIHRVGPSGADAQPRLGRADRVVADLGVALGMRIDAAAPMTRHHLPAKTDAEIRLLVAQRHADPVDLALDEILLVVGALRAAKDHRAGALVQPFKR